MSKLTATKVKDCAATVLVGCYVLYMLCSLFMGGNLLIGLLLLSAPTAAFVHLLMGDRESSAKRVLLPYAFGVPLLTGALALILTAVNLQQLLNVPYAVVGLVLNGATVLATALCFFGGFSFPKRAGVLTVGSLLYVLAGAGYLVLAFVEAGGWEEAFELDPSALIGYFCSLLFYLGMLLFSINKKEK